MPYDYFMKIMGFDVAWKEIRRVPTDLLEKSA